MPKYIKKKALKNAIECCTWYHINKNGELVEGAGVEDEPLYKYSDIKKIIKGLPTRKFKDEQQIDDLATAIANGAYCKTCKHLPDEDCDCDVVFTGYEPKDEPTISKMEQVEDDAYFLELMGAVERGEISDAGANQAWYEYINHKDEPQTCEECEHWNDTEDGCADRHGCKTDCPWK